MCTQEQCKCQTMIVDLLQAMAAQSNLLAEQNKLMAQIIDQNNALMSQDEDDEPTVPRYLDD